jgi:predicted transcriptional regulator
LEEGRLNQEALDHADFSWAKPYIDEGMADLEAGRVYPAEQVHAEIRAMFVRPKGT